MAIPRDTELLHIIESVAREKGLDPEVSFRAIEKAIENAGKKKYGNEHNIVGEVDRKTGEKSIYRIVDVVETEEEVEDTHTQISLENARKSDPELNVGDQIRDKLPPMDFKRVIAQSAKQVIVSEIKEAEREKQYDEFKDRKDTIINGIVKRTEYNDVFIEVNGIEAVIKRNALIPREAFRTGDRVRAYVTDVRREPSGPQVFLSRTAGDFMSKLFAQEVPEVYDGVIEIKAVARDAGSRAKIAVYSTDSGIDPVGSCVGVRGARVQAVVNELQGEKIDIIQWHADPASFVVEAIAPAEVSRVVVDEDAHKIDAILEENQLSLAIGRGGQNVRLASKLCGWKIDVMTEDEASSKRNIQFTAATKVFLDALDVDEMIAQLLVLEGFSQVEEVAYIDLEVLIDIEGFDEAIAEELQNRAKSYMEKQEKELEEEWKGAGVCEDLLELPYVTTSRLVEFGKKEIKTRDDLGELASDEFTEMFPKSGLSHEEIDEMIMAARAHWFDDEEAEEKAEDKAE